MKKIILAIIFLMLNFGVYSQSMGIGATNFTPNSKSILEIQATGKGLLIPRMELANRPNGLSSTDEGMLIYQTDGTHGFYYYDGANWKLLFTDAWSLNGNTGTNPINNFIGTRDSIDLVFRTNLNERMRISSSGLIKTKNAICTEESTFDILEGNYNNINIGNSGFIVINSTINTPTYIINETFESSNSFTLIQSGQTNYWYKGTATAYSGSSSLYITNNGSANTYTINTSSVSHAYKDITIPPGSINVNFSFIWKCYGESSYDYLKVWLLPTTTLPVSGTELTSTDGILLGTYNQNSSFNQVNLDLSSYAGMSKRIVFQWRNDASVGTDPPAAIDNILLSCDKKSVITGFNGGTNGRMLNVFFNTAHNIQINNKDASSSADNQIITNTGQNISLFGNGSATFIYSGSLKKWILISWLP